MSAADLFEWFAVLVMAPIATAVVLVRLATAIYVYVDIMSRVKNRLFAAALTVAVALGAWPITFFAYLVCTIVIDRSRNPHAAV